MLCTKSDEDNLGLKVEVVFLSDIHLDKKVGEFMIWLHKDFLPVVTLCSMSISLFTRQIHSQCSS